MTTAPERLTAALVDRYRVERELGQGGMATVYLAEDIRHHRKVALKVLRPELAAVIGAERFLHEITTTANLQHPHILGLHDSGQVDGTVFYVMPFVEGESLRDRLNREKQLPVDQAVRVAREVAGALDYAHRHGVIHRDIKPENILLHDGSALVADFGIALAASRTGGSRMTETGMSLGTPHYMSPEQAMGERELDARTDVYALGCVLYEMLSGEPPFDGPTPQAIVARVLTEAPRSLRVLRPSVPIEVDATVVRALEKLPADRFSSAAEFAAALTEEQGTRAHRREPTRLPAHPPTLLLVGAVLVTGALAAWGWLRPREEAGVSRLEVALEDFYTDSDDAPAVSPDGRTLIFPTGTEAWALRDLAVLRATPMPGQIWAPFFSPDGSAFGFFVGFPGDLRLMTVRTHAVTTLVHDSTFGFGGSWSEDGWIYYTASAGRSLLRIRPGGGPAELIYRVDPERGEFGVRWPEVLPDGKGILATLWRQDGAPDIVVIEPGISTPRVIAPGLRAFYLPSGHIAVVKGDATVVAARFRLRTAEMVGTPVELMSGVRINAAGAPAIGMSRNGTVLQINTGRKSRLLRVDRDGRANVVDPRLDGEMGWPALSPDGTQLALGNAMDGRREIWVKTLPTGPFVRVAALGSQNYRPFWSADGRSIGFTTDVNGLSMVFRTTPDGAGKAAPILEHSTSVDEGEWSPDGKWFVFRAGSGLGRDIFGFRPGVDSAPLPLVVTASEEFSPTVSPDGRWLAYASSGSGRDEVFVRSLVDSTGGRVQVSVEGGNEPAWSHDGRELYYRSGNGEQDLIAVSVAPGPAFRITGRGTLFPTKAYHTDARHRGYAVGKDGSFYFFQRTDMPTAPGVLIQNWLEELKAKVP